MMMVKGSPSFARTLSNFFWSFRLCEPRGGVTERQRRRKADRRTDRKERRRADGAVQQVKNN